MWDPVGEEGVLTDFDLESHSNEDPIGGRANLVADLLECKMVCDNRATRLARDMIEPYVWMLVFTCIYADVSGRGPPGPVGGL